MPIPFLKSARIAAIMLSFVVASAMPAAAQGYISPFLGFDFGGNSGCPEITGCEDKRLNWGVGLGALGNVFGFEWEFGYANNFFGEAEGLESSVLTVMGNAMFVPDIGPVRPYALAGLGLIKTNIETLTPGEVLTSDNNNFGWNLGGGLMIFFGDNVGIRGDIRYFHAFQDLDLLGFTIADAKLDFGRAAGAVVFKF
jgi:opacity protein-like surface antigen